MKILIYSDVKENFYGSQLPYLDFFSQFGNVVIAPVMKRESKLREVNEFAREELSRVDLLVSPGGLDVSSLSFGKAPDVMAGRTNQFFEFWDKILLKNALEMGVPVVGICRGAQALGVALGGSMVQHLAYHKYSSPRSELVHDTVFTEKGISILNRNIDSSVLKTVLKKSKYHADSKVIETNSLHHQAISVDNAPIDVLAYSNGMDGFRKWIAIPEIISSKDGKSIGFQYHPEEMDCEIASGLIQSLIEHGTIYR
jgi:putative glutamine amidotransferase